MSGNLRSVLKVAAGAAIICNLLVFQAGAGPPSAEGVWKQVGENGEVGALVSISEEDGVYVGRLSRLFLEPGEDPDPICTKCPGEKRNQPILGLVFIEGMKRSGLDYEGGTILDPETGNIYKASMSLDPGGAELTVRGYIGLPVFGRSQVWIRAE